MESKLPTRHSRSRSTLARLLGVLALTMSLTGIAMAAEVAPAAAEDGGCSQSPTAQGWQMAVCSSDDGISVFGDIYINSRGSNPDGCRVAYQIWNLNTGRPVGEFSGWNSCYLGHHPNVRAKPKVAGVHYKNIAVLVVNDVTVIRWSSIETT